MIGHAEQRVQRWCELTQQDAADLRQVATPSIDDHHLPPEDTVAPGQFGTDFSTDHPQVPLPGENWTTRSPFRSQRLGTHGERMDESL